MVTQPVVEDTPLLMRNELSRCIMRARWFATAYYAEARRRHREASAAFTVLQAQSDATWIGVVTDEDRDAGEPERERLYSEQEPFVDVMCDTPAHALAGHRAKAHALVAFFPDILRKPSGYDGEPAAGSD